jgi:hypothetical protein
MLPRALPHILGKDVEKLCDRGFVIQRVESHMFNQRAIERPRPMNDSTDIALDSTPVTLVLRSDWNDNVILYVQKAVFVTEDELNRVNGDVVPKIMPTNSEGVE